MKVVIMGAPSCGKGIQAKLLEQNFGFAHISTGQILRDFTNQKNKKRGIHHGKRYRRREPENAL